MKIVAQYNTSDDENSLGWSWRGGIKLQKQGELVEVRKFQPPVVPENNPCMQAMAAAHLKEYESE